MANENRFIGQGINRVDGILKVTGKARYAAEFPANNVAYGYALNSTIASGKIRSMDTSAAEKAPGVLKVITHKNVPKMPLPEKLTAENRMTRSVPVFQDTQIHHHGQFIGVILAETYEQARYAARLVKVVYDKEIPKVDFKANQKNAYAPKTINGGNKTDTVRGDVAQGLSTAAATIEAVYDTPVEHHHPMETHGIVATWEGDQVTVYYSTQMVENTTKAIATTFQIPIENVHVLAPYIGGGFGSKLRTGENAMMAIMAARLLKRPVKLVLTRQQMFMNVGLRQRNQQKMRLGATKDGALTALAHESMTHTSTTEEFIEQCGVISRMMYNVPNSLVTHRAFRLNVQTPRWTRAPGEAPGSFALESAMDELAYKLKIDPVEFRIKNDVATDLDTNKPFSSRSLVECLKTGAEKFGWNKRKAEPRANPQGKWLVGYGMSAASRGAPYKETSAQIKLTRQNGTVKAMVELSATDIGTGSYTIIAQTAAENLGIPIENIEVKIGDSTLPPTPGSGGSWGAGSFTSGVLAACEEAKTQLLAKVNVQFVKAPTVAELMQAGNIPEFQVKATSKTPPEAEQHSMYTFGAHFVEVWVDEALGIVRIPRYLATVAAGRILNPKTASSQMIGGIVWGIGMALTEESHLDNRYGNFITRTLADYHVPVNLDIGEIEVIFIPEEDKIVNPIGAKGIGEISITSVAAAVANAIFNATGKRVRSLPITPDKVI